MREMDGGREGGRERNKMVITECRKYNEKRARKREGGRDRWMEKEREGEREGKEQTKEGGKELGREEERRVKQPLNNESEHTGFQTLKL